MFAVSAHKSGAGHRSLSVRLDEENLNGLLILCEMLIPFEGAALLDAVSSIEEFRITSLTDSGEVARKELSRGLRFLKKQARKFGWTRVTTQIDYLAGDLEHNSESASVMSQLGQLQVSLYAECNHHLFFVLPERYRHLVEHWPGKVPFGPEVRSRFSRSCADIDAASRCLAFGLYTACVYHLMGILQEGVNAIARDLAVPVLLTSTWEEITGKFDGQLNVKRAAMNKVQWKRVEPFYSEALSDLRSVKNAWRNPTMHFTRTYGEQEAGKIFDRTEAFMVHLATRLRQAPPQK